MRQSERYDNISTHKEIEDRQWGSLGSALNFEYDAGGNTREKPLSSTAEFRYTHDAWNRMVKSSRCERHGDHDHRAGA